MIYFGLSSKAVAEPITVQEAGCGARVEGAKVRGRLQGAGCGGDDEDL